jgi:hypothetical protein
MGILTKNFKKILGVLILMPALIWCIATTYFYKSLQYVGNELDIEHAGGRYYKNGTSVYYQYRSGGFSISPQLTKVKDADAASFECIRTPVGYQKLRMSCQHKAQDKNHVYSYGQIDTSESRGF